ncbi:MAG: hypothetical protein ABJ275_11115 [Maricaulaceae bacterium]
MNKSQINLLQKTILKSSIKAFQKYNKITEGAWLYNTPEYWYTTHIAIALKKKLPEFSFFIENSIAEVRQYATKGAGRPSKRLGTGRTDISVWKYWKSKDDYTPKCIIEVKRAWAWNSQTMTPDIDRLCASIMETDKSISKAYFVVLSDEEDRVTKSTRSSLNERCTTIHSNIDEYINSKKMPIRVDSELKLSKYYEEDESMFAAMLFTLALDNRKK